MVACVVVCYVQVTISRLMEQLSDPAELLAVHIYFPDMLLLRLFSLRVPVFSSKTASNTEEYSQACMHTQYSIICDQIRRKSISHYNSTTIITSSEIKHWVAVSFQKPDWR